MDGPLQTFGKRLADHSCRPTSEQGLLRVPFASRPTSIRQNRVVAVVEPCSILGFASLTFISHLKTVLFSRVGVVSASEYSEYIYLRGSI